MSFPPTVLIADDEAHIRKFVGLILKSLGATRLIEAANGEEAVALYTQEKPDLVLLDVNMPKVDGLEALRQIRALNPDALIIMLTSLTTRQVVETAIEHGAVNYIRKDTPKNEMAKAISESVVTAKEGENPA